MKSQTVKISKNITESPIFRNPQTMQLLWYILLSSDKKEKKLKTTQAHITEITGLSKPVTEKAIDILKTAGYISKRVTKENISIQIKTDFPYLTKRKSRDFFRIDFNVLHFDWFNEIQTRHLWIYLLLKANSEPIAFKSTVIDRGELIATVASISTATGLTVSQVRTALEKLKNSNCIKIKPTNKYTVIKITDYESYI